MGLGRVVHEVLEFCYPSTCALCSALDAEGGVCASCAAGLDRLAARGQCAACARPLPGGDASPCPYCKGKGMYPFQQMASLGVFEDPLKELIHVMKYQRRWTLGEQLAERLATLDPVRRVVAASDVIVPVPLWRWRQVGRGYNQSAVIARSLGAALGKPVVECVVRVRNTPSQVELKARDKRVENVRGAFRLKSDKRVRGRRVCVVDDVTTTGATLKEVGRVLAGAGPCGLNAVVLAVADPKGRGFEAI
jgi:ComF family protein